MLIYILFIVRNNSWYEPVRSFRPGYTVTCLELPMDNNLSGVRRHAPPTLTAILIAMMVLPRHTTVSLVRIRHKRLETSLDMLVLQVTISSVIGKL